MEPLLGLRMLSAAAFLAYGSLCLGSPAMAVEFERYRLPRLRVPTAALEIAGALGLLFGPTPTWVVAAATGLCGLMLAALIVRVRIRDAWFRSLPALVLLALNAWIAVETAGLDAG